MIAKEVDDERQMETTAAAEKQEGRSTGPVDRPACFSAAAVVSICLSLSTSLAIFDNTWQSCQFIGNILSFQQFSTSVKISKSEPNTDSITAAPHGCRLSKKSLKDKPLKSRVSSVGP